MEATNQRGQRQGSKPCTPQSVGNESACKDVPEIQLRSCVSADSEDMSKHSHAPSAFIYCIDCPLDTIVFLSHTSYCLSLLIVQGLDFLFCSP